MLSKHLLISILLLAGLNSCEKGTEPTVEEKKINYFTYDGNTFELEGVLVDNYEYGSNNEKRAHDIFLYSSSISLVPNTFNPDFLVPSGEGAYVLIYAVSDLTDDIKDGTYIYGVTENYNVWGGEFLINPKYSSKSIEEYELFKDGEPFIVAIDGNSYSFDFNLTTESGKKITGNYTGEITQQ